MAAYKIGDVHIRLSNNPPNHPTQFVVMLSGAECTNNAHYWNSLVGQGCVVVQPKKKNLWERRNRGYLKSVFDHLLANYDVKGGKFVLHGHSNGTAGMLDFACEYPELCCGIVVVAAIGIQPYDRLHKLRGIPIAHYWGDCDGFHRANLKLQQHLRDHTPYHIQCIPGAGHKPHQIDRGGALHRDVIASIQKMFGSDSNGFHTFRGSSGGVTPATSFGSGSACAICGGAGEGALRSVYGNKCCNSGPCRADYLAAKRTFQRTFGRNEATIEGECLQYVMNKRQRRR
jgi:hypothetical protein